MSFARELKRVVFFGILGLLVGCAGYVPISKYARERLPDPVYVKIYLSGAEPQNGVYIKDEINRVLITRFHNKITKKRTLSNSQIYVTRYRINTEPLTYDRDGLVTRYRVSTEIEFELRSSRGNLKKVISDSEEVGIEASSLISSAEKESAIRKSIREAMDKFIAVIGEEGYLIK